MARKYTAKKVSMKTEDAAPVANITGTGSISTPPTTTPEKWRKKLKFLARRANPNGSGK